MIINIILDIMIILHDLVLLRMNTFKVEETELQLFSIISTMFLKEEIPGSFFFFSRKEMLSTSVSFSVGESAYFQKLDFLLLKTHFLFQSRQPTGSTMQKLAASEV